MYTEDLFPQEWREFKEKHLVTPGVNFEPDALKYKALLMRSGPNDFCPKINKPMTRVGQFGDILEGREKGEFYLRFGGNIVTALEERMVLAEAGYLIDKGVDPFEHIDAAFLPSGMAAIHATARAIVTYISGETRARLLINWRNNKEEDHRPLFVQGDCVYSRTNRVLGPMMEDLCIAPAEKIDTTERELVVKRLLALRERPLGLYYEPVTNPLLNYSDTRRIYKAMKSFGIRVPIIVDNTFLTPYLQQTFRMGADVIIHSVTKYWNGEGDIFGGYVTGPKALIKKIKEFRGDASVAVQSPELGKFLYERIANMPCRMEQHIKNADDIADYLLSAQEQGYVERVISPIIDSETRYGSSGAVLCFVMAGDSPEEKIEKERALMEEVIKHPSVIEYAVSFGHREYLMVGETTLGVPKSDLPPGFVRFAVGREPKASEVIDFLKQSFMTIYGR